ncbi:MAG: archease [Thermoproteota archaeon]
MSERSYEFLEHTSDVYVAARGRTLGDAFASAALAMCNVLTDPSKVRPREREEIEIRAEDPESLLYRWLESLLVKFEVDGKLYSKHSVKIIKQGEAYLLRAVVEGERYDPDIHPSGIAVKAVTYHGMKIMCREESCEVRVLFDI